MSFEIRVTFKDDYIEACITGDDSYEISLELWKRISEECNKHQCYKILGISDTPPSSTIDAFNHYKIFKETGITVSHCIAWVDMNPKSFEDTRFIETVLLNRGLLTGRLFSDITEAKSWLLNKNEQA